MFDYTCKHQPLLVGDRYSSWPGVGKKFWSYPDPLLYYLVFCFTSILIRISCQYTAQTTFQYQCVSFRDLHLDDAVENPNNSDINDIDLLFSQKGKIKSRGRLILTQDQRYHVVLSLSYMVAMWVQQLQPPHLCSRKEHGREKNTSGRRISSL